jgi:hypothetical protein
MTRRRPTTQPVPVTPTHRRDWRTLWRRCSCGLTCPCVDRLVPVKRRPFPPSTATTWPSPTTREDRRPIPPALIGYLATAPFPIPGGYTTLRPIPFPHSALPLALPRWAARRSPPGWPPPRARPIPTPEPQLTGAAAAHPGGRGATGGPGASPCPGSRAGAAPITASRWPLPRRPADDADRTAATRAPASNPTAADASRTAATPPPAGGGTPELGERAGRAGAPGSRADPDGGRRGHPPDFKGRPGMAYHHINLSRR